MSPDSTQRAEIERLLPAICARRSRCLLQVILYSRNILAMSSNSGPGYQKHPDHRVETQPALGRVQVRVNGDVIADSRDAVELRESNHATVYYLPRRDVQMERLARSTHRTYCPFKGHASYYSVINGPENAVWVYEQPYDEVHAIKDRLAFYSDKVDSITLIG